MIQNQPQFWLILNRNRLKLNQTIRNRIFDFKIGTNGKVSLSFFILLTEKLDCKYQFLIFSILEPYIVKISSAVLERNEYSNLQKKLIFIRSAIGMG